MFENAASRYQAVQVSTSNPGELLIALLDGFFKFLNQGRHLLRNGARAPAGEAICRAHAILSELYVSLDHAQAPDLCRNLEGVYGFCLDKIVYANRHNDPSALDEVLRVMTPVREAFTTVVRATRHERPAP
ncbi:MAG: flagellar export chaperone FliS [Deltaproteobacteria bacterium]|nr:flagellar export chaperone FliS [Deltaproteobacteria bacterium]